MNYLKLILGLLPFNKSKTKLGVLLGLAAILQQFVPGLDLVALVQSLLTEHLSVTAIVTIIVGAVHKVLKGDVDSDENL
jgi:hypothetical protein